MRQAHGFLMRSIIKAALFVHFEWHLTPSGWVPGDWSANDEPIEPKMLPPVDRIETWETTVTSYDGQVTKVKMDWALIWASPQHSEAERRGLRAWHHKPGRESQNPKVTSWDYPL